MEFTFRMNLILPLRIAQAILALIVLGLAGYCVDALGHYPEAAFLVFTSVWSFLVLAYLLVTPMYYPEMHNRWVVVGSEGVTMIFWFAGFIAIADTTSASRFKCFGEGCRVLSCAKAAAAMGAFAWIAWSATLALIIHALIQYRKGGSAADPDAEAAARAT